MAPKSKRKGSRYGLSLGGGTTRGGTPDRVTDALREAILSGRLPPSTWLREEEIAEELSVSRTPVREALRRLAGEGLTVKTAHQGTVVAPLTIEDVLAIYVVRESLEGLAARLAASRNPSGLAERLEELHKSMEAAHEKGRSDELIALNVEFHRAIREAAGNGYLDRFLSQVQDAVRRFPHSTYESKERAAEAIAEHQELIDAIVSGDAELAEQLSRAHMRRARELRTRMLLDVA